MKTLQHLLQTALLLAAVVPTLLSCGEMFEDMPPIETAIEMSFDRHALTLMEGDSCHINMHFTPDSVTNQSAYWWAEHPDRVILRNNGTVIGFRSGKTDVMATAMNNHKSDTCKVNVLPLWTIERVPSLPYDMVIYATVQIDGKPLVPRQQVAAYCGNELRGIGTLRTEHGIDYLRLRIYSPNSGGDKITLYYYDQENYRIVPATETFTFSETTIGTLSALHPIHFSTKE